MSTEKLDSPEYSVPPELQGLVALTTLDRIYNWGRRNSVWPMMFGLACCAIEQICAAAARFDLGRLGMEVMRASPRQADVMLISGTVTKKMAPQIVRLYNQMGEPKYVVAVGACACGGGPFKEGYSVVSGIDRYLPVDVYVAGCPPTPQALLNGLICIQKKIDKEPIKEVRWYKKGPSVPIPVPILGPDLMNPLQYEQILKASQEKLLAEQAAQQEDIEPSTGGQNG